MCCLTAMYVCGDGTEAAPVICNYTWILAVTLKGEVSTQVAGRSSGKVTNVEHCR